MKACSAWPTVEVELVSVLSVADVLVVDVAAELGATVGCWRL